MNILMVNSRCLHNYFKDVGINYTLICDKFFFINQVKVGRHESIDKSLFFLYLIIIVRTGLESLAQRVDGLRPKKPNTMNL